MFRACQALNRLKPINRKALTEISVRAYFFLEPAKRLELLTC